MNLNDDSAIDGTNQVNPNFQVQDYDAFPTLQAGTGNEWAHSPASSQAANSQANIYSYSSSQGSGSYLTSPQRPLVPRTVSLNALPTSPKPGSSRPASRHQSRAPTPSIPAVDDTDAFPTLGTIGGKGAKKHHGKRGGHGHGHSHGNKESFHNSLADIVRNSPSLSPSLLRKGLIKRSSYTGSRENSVAANAIPAPQHIPWLETGDRANQAYLKARQDAFKHGGVRNKFLQRSDGRTFLVRW